MNCRKLMGKALIIGISMSVIASTYVFAAAKGVIIGDNVNVRSESNSNSDKLSVLGADVEVEVIERSNGFYKVSFGTFDEAYIAEDYVKIVEAPGVANDSSVNVRSLPTKDASLLGIINEGDTVIVTGQTSQWFEVRRVNGGKAYIYKDYIDGGLLALVPPIANGAEGSGELKEVTYAIVTAQTGLNLRQEGSSTGEIITKLPNGEVVDVVEAGGQWIKVKTSGGATGFVSAEFISIRTGEKPSRGLATTKGEQIVEYGKQFLGTPYSWGGTNLNQGVDCSGFVYSVMKDFGINLNRSSYDMVNNGVYVEKTSLVAGDIVLFDTSGVNDGKISHVGIYIENGDFIHSSSSQRSWGVVISNLNTEDYYIKSYVTARRVIR